MSHLSHTRPRPLAAILVVDDDLAVRESLSDFLTDEGYAVRTAVDGADALAQLAPPHDKPALVLLDMAMPVMSGSEVLRRMADDPRLADIPVLVVSATTQGLLPRSGVKILPKPVESEALMRAVRSSLAPPSAVP